MSAPTAAAPLVDNKQSYEKLQSVDAVPNDGSAALAEKRRKRYATYCILMGVYLVTGAVFYSFQEGWDVLESIVFTLSVLTGCGYGHLIPATSFGMVFTSFYIFFGLLIFATVAGHVLDMLMAGEIAAATAAIKQEMSGDAAGARLSYTEKRMRDKRNHFLVGLANVGVLYVVSLLLFSFAFKETLVDSIYLSSIAVLKLDSICLIDDVKCSHGWHSSEGGQPKWLAFAIFWYILTYSTIGHFLVSASNYLGTDPEARMSKLTSLSPDRLQRMDKDNDGKVTRSEFLRDRLIQGNIVEKEQIDAILRNFDQLDIDNSGTLNQADLGGKV